MQDASSSTSGHQNERVLSGRLWWSFSAAFIASFYNNLSSRSPSRIAFNTNSTTLTHYRDPLWGQKMYRVCIMRICTKYGNKRGQTHFVVFVVQKLIVSKRQYILSDDI